MKICVKELQLALDQLKENSGDDQVRVVENSGRLSIDISWFDRDGRNQTASIFDVSTRMFPEIKITKRLTK